MSARPSNTAAHATNHAGPEYITETPMQDPRIRTTEAYSDRNSILIS